MCNGICTGLAVASPSGGTAPYTYLWNDPLAQTNDTASALCVGTYQVLVTDSNGCIDSVSITITEPTQLSVFSDSLNASCNGVCDGQAIAIPDGGTPPYTINGEVENLETGTYSVTVTDDQGCTTLPTEFFINEPEELLITSIETTDASCSGFSDGSAIVNIEGGTPPYTIN